MGSVDQGFVPAAPDRVYPRLAGVDRYGEWWPGARSARAGEAFELRLPGFPTATVRIEAERPGTGLVLRLSGGRAAGSLEWYLEPHKEGTIVNAIYDAVGDGAGTRVIRRMRREIRNGLVALRALGSG